MDKFTTWTAVAVPFDQPNIDTNALCPTRFNKVEKGPKYAQVLFHDLRFNPDGSEKPDFILNQPPYRKAGIIVAERNFGCGTGFLMARPSGQDFVVSLDGLSSVDRQDILRAGRHGDHAIHNSAKHDVVARPRERLGEGRGAVRGDRADTRDDRRSHRRGWCHRRAP